MEFSTSLLAKALGGLAVASAVTIVGVVKKDSIATALGLKNNPQKEKKVDIKSEVNKKLIEHLKESEKDITFKAYTGETEETPLGSDFPNFDNGNPITIRFTISTKDTSSLTGDANKAKEKELKRLLGIQESENLIWECRIKFSKIGTGTTWQTTEKDIFYKSNGGWYQKITKAGNKPFKKRFIKQCSELTYTHKENSPIKLEKKFNLTGENELTIQNSKDFKSWFGEMKLTEEEKNEIENNKSWFPVLDESAKTLTLSGAQEIDSCVINLTISNISSIKTNIENKFGKDSNVSDQHKKYRRGFLKKCRNTTSSISLTDSSSIESLFDLSDEELTSKEEKIKNLKAENPVSDATNSTITIEINFEENNTKTQICKILGTKKSGESINSNHLESSKENIKTTLQNKLTANNDDTQKLKNLLTKCKRSFEETIKFNLNKKTSPNNEYELENVDSIFSP